MPFLFVQIANFNAPANPRWALFRDEQRKALALPNTGMAVTIDIGEANDNHPKNKAEVGRRLSLWALGTVYHHEVSSISGPVPSLREVHDDQIVVTFDHADEGLVAKGGELKGFQIAGEDKVWKPAKTKIAGNEVLVSHPEISKPVAVRYAWADNPVANVCSPEGLPLNSFRTDDFPMITDPKNPNGVAAQAAQRQEAIRQLQQKRLEVQKKLQEQKAKAKAEAVPKS